MIINPSIRHNFFTNAHPLGCEQTILKQIKEIQQLTPFTGPTNVLIIGGSSGYGLASRISLAFGAHANTLNVSYESLPRGKRTGSAGYWNNIFFQHHANQLNTTHMDIIGDAFSPEIKQQVIDTVKQHFNKIDLVIYSLAAGARKDPKTNDIIHSQIKPIGKLISGVTIDIASNTLKEISLTPATKEDIDDTIYVMGGSDWSEWLHTLADKAVLAKGVKTIAYTYVGAESTQTIYRSGTLGKAKQDLEQHRHKLNDFLDNTYQGEALISSSKAVISKASVFIPKMPLYVSALFDVMKENFVHESILAHKYRLFKDMVYGNKRVLDDKFRLRLDHYELNDKIQKQTLDLMHKLEKDTTLSHPSINYFLNEFYQINGFNYPQINYQEDLDIALLINTYHLM